MSKTVCSWCKAPLVLKDDVLVCGNTDCPACDEKYLHEDLIRTRKELEQSETCCTEWEKQALDYKAENIALSGELERTRKALDVAVDAIDDILCLDSGKFIQEPIEMWKIAKSAKDKITALEQKDVK